MSEVRLIDANALKDRLEQYRFAIVGFEGVLSVIDNMPTVEYTFEEAFQKAVCEKKIYCPERPQTIDCTNCKHESKRLIDEPCKYCNIKYSEWEAKDETN